jgi:hypothetical protein
MISSRTLSIRSLSVELSVNASREYVLLISIFVLFGSLGSLGLLWLLGLLGLLGLFGTTTTTNHPPPPPPPAPPPAPGSKTRKQEPRGMLRPMSSRVLDEEVGRRRRGKEKVVAVKMHAVKFIMGIIFVVALLVAGVYLTNMYDLSIERRHIFSEHRREEIQRARLDQQIADRTIELQSHLVAEVQEQAHVDKLRDEALKKVRVETW